MAKQTEIVENAQGAEPTNTEGLTTENIQEIEKQRKDSFPYALKQFKTMVEKLERNKWVSKDESETLRIIHRGMVDRFIGLEML